MDAFYSIYTYSKILAVDMHIEVINLDTVPYEFVMTTMPYGDITGASIDQAKQSRGAVVKTIGGSSGFNRIVMKKHYNTEEIVGYHLADRDTRMTLADANNTGYADADLPAIVFWPSLVTGASTNGVSISVVQTYHLCFFDINLPPVSALHNIWPDPPLKEEELMDDEKSFTDVKDISNNAPSKRGEDELKWVKQFRLKQEPLDQKSKVGSRK
jgi:hypothetical protein